jgi:cobalt/nickel transport system permease protein
MGLLPFAVHISDGVLTTPWLAAGFGGMVLLMLAGCRRVRDEEIPRIALLTAAFFVASLIHLRVGPTTVHLLLNGLVGVVLGRRSGLAIPLGLLLQAVLFQHGGISTLGVNACVLTVPALAAGGLFGLLYRSARRSNEWLRTGLVFCSTAVWFLCLVFSLGLLTANRGTSLAQLDAAPALHWISHPGVLALVAAAAIAAVWLERREGGGPAFAIGLALGVFAALLTAALNAAVLVYGGAEDWHSLVLLVFVAHMPVAALEGIVLGFSVSYLARVKPQMLGECWHMDAGLAAPPSSESPLEAARPAGASLPTLLLLAALAGLGTPGRASAHRLEAEYRVLPDGRIQVESWFDLTGDSPQGAVVEVFRPDGGLVVQGKLDEKGLFTFAAPNMWPLRVVVSAGAGHRKELTIQKASPKQTIAIGADVDSISSSSRATSGIPFADRTPRVSLKDALTGVALVLSLAAFVMALRNQRRIEELRKPRDPA